MDSVVLRRTLLRQNGFAFLKVHGKSMRPILWGGDHCVAVEPVEGEPEPGDLIMFRMRAGGEERSIVHRLIGTRRDDDGRLLYIMRGDNCLGCECVRRSDIIGRVAEVHRMSGFRPWHLIHSRRFAVTDRGYRLYSRLWVAIWPARRLCYLVRARVCGICHRVLTLIKSSFKNES